MSQLFQQVYSSARPDSVPKIFSKTENFRFDRDSGSAVHTVLPSGPKGFGVFRISSTGHQATLTEQNRTAVSIQLSGLAEVKTARTAFVAGPGDITVLGPSRRHIALRPPKAASYNSYSVIAPAVSGVIRFAREPKVATRMGTDTRNCANSWITRSGCFPFRAPIPTTTGSGRPSKPLSRRVSAAFSTATSGSSRRTGNGTAMTGSSAGSGHSWPVTGPTRQR